MVELKLDQHVGCQIFGHYEKHCGSTVEYSLQNPRWLSVYSINYSSVA